MSGREKDGRNHSESWTLFFLLVSQETLHQPLQMELRWLFVRRQPYKGHAQVSDERGTFSETALEKGGCAITTLEVL